MIIFLMYFVFEILNISNKKKYIRNKRNFIETTRIFKTQSMKNFYEKNISNTCSLKKMISERI